MFSELGEKLRSYRQDAGFEVEDLASRTRIAARYVRALEEGRVDLLPGKAFVKGFIRSLCAELEKDPEPLLELLTEIDEAESQEENNGSTDTKKPFPLFLTGGILLVLGVGGVLLHGGGDKTTEPIPGPVSVSSEPAGQVVRENEPFPQPGVNQQEELDLVIRAVEKTWLRVQVDSSKTWETTMKTGDEIRLRGMERINLFIGTAGGIFFELNGRRFGPPGSAGQVISNYVITRDNL